MIEKLTLDPRDYQDGVVRLRIKKFNVPKAVLSGFALWEFYKGSWFTIWDGKDSDGNIVANGVYFVRVETQDKIATGKIVILR